MIKPKTHKSFHELVKQTQHTLKNEGTSCSISELVDIIDELGFKPDLDHSSLTNNGHYYKLITNYLIPAFRDHRTSRAVAQNRLREFIESRKQNKKQIKSKKIKNYSEFWADSKLSIKGNLFDREMPKKQIKIWQEIDVLGLQTEKIIRTHKKKLTLHVISKIEGIHINKNWPNNAKLLIFSQILRTMTGLWENGYAHGHPHLKNWVVRFENGTPVVTLIDFDLATNNKKFLGSDMSKIIELSNNIFPVLQNPKNKKEKNISERNKKITDKVKIYLEKKKKELQSQRS